MLCEKTNLLKSWRDHAKIYKWLHFQTSNLLFQKSFSISIPILILNTISGGLIYNTELFSSSKRNLIIFECIVGSINMICAILSGIRDYCKFGELGKIHEQCYQNWSRLKNEINVELASPLENNKLDDFISKIKLRYSDLMTSSPNIPLNIINKFKKDFKKIDDIELPDIVQSIPPINDFIYDVDLDV
tara:strand:- start:2424 stop:2987 length:564 start_codon:yes stop_codon:yes gene_type:complete